MARIRVMASDATGAGGQGTTPGDFLLVDDPPTRTITYTYDSLNRLVGVAYSDGSTITYEYDAVGNRTAMVSVGGLIFADGFETGDISAWSQSVP
jgi:YD repeat-containing protein